MLRHLRKIGSWFWRGEALASVRAQAISAAPTVMEYHRLARLSFEVAERVFEPSGPLLNGTAEHIAYELFQRACYWDLLAAREASSTARHSSELPTMAELWHSADPKLLLDAAGSQEILAGLEREVQDTDGARAALLPRPAQQRLAQDFRAFGFALQRKLEAAQVATDKLYRQRFRRLALMLLVAILAATSIPVLGVLKDRRMRARDLAHNKPWKASSTSTWCNPTTGAPGCLSPSQDCPESIASTFFFHTLEDDSPWLEIDLGKPTSFSTVWVKNRGAELERAVPLVVEISSDEKQWHEVARRTEVFAIWTAHFKAVQARWVRIRIARRSWLHLGAVRVLP